MLFRTLKSLGIVREVTFAFDTDDGDGYVDSAGADVTVTAGSYEGEYDITLSRGFGSYTLIDATANLYKSGGATDNDVRFTDLSTVLTAGTCSVATFVSGTAGTVPDATVYISLKFKRN